MSVERLTYRDENGEAWYSDAGTEAERLHFIADTEDILGDDYDLDRLRELVQADREGKCAALPCKIGSLVYSHARNFDGKDYVKETEFWWSDIPQIGKTVFLTREEARGALRRKQNE